MLYWLQTAGSQEQDTFVCWEQCEIWSFLYLSKQNTSHGAVSYGTNIVKISMKKNNYANKPWSGLPMI